MLLDFRAVGRPSIDVTQSMNPKPFSARKVLTCRAEGSKGFWAWGAAGLGLS